MKPETFKEKTIDTEIVPSESFSGYNSCLRVSLFKGRYTYWYTCSCVTRDTIAVALKHFPLPRLDVSFAKNSRNTSLAIEGNSKLPKKPITVYIIGNFGRSLKLDEVFQ